VQDSGVTTDAAPPGQPSAIVALLTWQDLLFCAKHLFVAAMVAGWGATWSTRAAFLDRLIISETTSNPFKGDGGPPAPQGRRVRRSGLLMPGKRLASFELRIGNPKRIGPKGSDYNRYCLRHRKAELARRPIECPPSVGRSPNTTRRPSAALAGARAKARAAPPGETFGTMVLSCVCRPRRIHRKIACSIRIFVI
jgi:hypothetical protein